EADVGVGGQVEAEVVPGHGAGQARQVEQVALDQPVAGPAALRQEGALAGREVVVDGHLVAVGQQAVDQVAADEAGAAGDEGTHQATSASAWAGLRATASRFSRSGSRMTRSPT